MVSPCIVGGDQRARRGPKDGPPLHIALGGVKRRRPDGLQILKSVFRQAHKGMDVAGFLPQIFVLDRLAARLYFDDAGFVLAGKRVLLGLVLRRGSRLRSRPAAGIDPGPREPPLSAYRDAEDLNQLGAYVAGSNQELQAAAALAAVDREREILLGGRADAEALVRGEAVPGEDLAALGAFRRHTDAEVKCIAQKRALSEKALEGQRGAMLKARRPLRLLGRLEERRYAEWSAAAMKELEEMASESYLSRWTVK